MLKTNNFNIEDYPKAARDPEQLLFPLHENPSLLFGSHSHSLSWSSSLPMGRPGHSSSCAGRFARIASTYFQAVGDEGGAGTARGLSPCAGQVALTGDFAQNAVIFHALIAHAARKISAIARAKP